MKTPALRHLLLAATLAFALSVAPLAQSTTTPLASQQPPPYWAFTVDPPNSPGKPTGNTPQHVPHSSQTFTLSQIADLFSVPDWHPDAHPAMPSVVGLGRKPDVIPCAYCHLPNGQGRPENSSLTGLQKAYIVQQMAAFKSGARKSSEPRLAPVNYMITIASHADDQEATAAAEYFSALKPKPWIHVVETPAVPKTHIAGWMLVADDPKLNEPIGNRIIETPENLELTELRDDTAGFIAFVPPERQKQRALHRRSLTQCGASTQLMQIPVLKLTTDDMLAIAAYLASLRP